MIEGHRINKILHHICFIKFVCFMVANENAIPRSFVAKLIHNMLMHN